MYKTERVLMPAEASIYAWLGERGMTRVVVDRYAVNDGWVTAARADGDCGEGPVRVTALRERSYGGAILNTTCMMCRVVATDNGANSLHDTATVSGVYADVARELACLIGNDPGVGLVELPLAAASRAHTALAA